MEGINDVGLFWICVSILNRLFQLLLIVIPDYMRSVWSCAQLVALVYEMYH